MPADTAKSAGNPGAFLLRQARAVASLVVSLAALLAGFVRVVFIAMVSALTLKTGLDAVLK